MTSSFPQIYANTEVFIKPISEAIKFMPKELYNNIQLYTYADFHTYAFEKKIDFRFAANAPHFFVFGRATGRIFTWPPLFTEYDAYRRVLIYHLDHGDVNSYMNWFFFDMLFFPYMFDFIDPPAGVHLVKFLLGYTHAVIAPAKNKPLLLNYRIELRKTLGREYATPDNIKKYDSSLHYELSQLGWWEE